MGYENIFLNVLEFLLIFYKMSSVYFMESTFIYISFVQGKQVVICDWH